VERRLLKVFPQGDVMLVDALDCNCLLIARLSAAGVNMLFELNGSRITDFRSSQSLGMCDHVVRWTKLAARAGG
jgi:hypothetical protein